MQEKLARGESVFTGSMFGLLGIELASIFLSTLTFGLAFPWLWCWRQSWYAEHTYINGKQLNFDGTGGQLFGKWLLWMLLMVVTFGIYGLWVPIKIEQWRISHTHFVEVCKSGCSEESVKSKALPAVDSGESVRFCTNCGYALRNGEAMIDEKYCKYCVPRPDAGVPEPVSVRKHNDRPSAPVKNTPSGGGFSRPGDSDLN